MEIWVGILMTVVIGFLTTFLLGYVIVPLLQKLKFGQVILDIGPVWHRSKQGVPTMGGILFMIGFAFAIGVTLLTDHLLGGDILVALSEKPDQIRIKVLAGILMAVGFGLIGFMDDYIKVKKNRNLGLTEVQKTLLQLFVITAFLAVLYFNGCDYMFIPYYGIWADMGIWFWLLGYVAIWCTVNAVNFADGIDGLCPSVTMVACVFFAVTAVMRGYGGVSLVASATFGALAGFLVWNWHPAKVIMGDIGSHFLGGIVVTLAYTLDAPWLILAVGIIYVAEFLSDVIQVFYIKTHNGQKLFKMAPLHHHYEMCGWNEKKIVTVFSIVGAIGGIVAVALTWFGRLQ